MEKQKEYNLCYLLAKVRTTLGKASDRLRQRAKRSNKNRVGRLPTSEQNWKIILSDEDRKGLKIHLEHNFHSGLHYSLYVAY
jgi:hypothetical protein